jgi:hypothetical protein
MPTQIVMDHTGDTRHQFDPSDAAGVAEAEARFEELTGAGFTAAERTGPGQSKVVAKFDPAAEETLLSPASRAGDVGSHHSVAPSFAAWLGAGHGRVLSIASSERRAKSRSSASMAFARPGRTILQIPAFRSGGLRHRHTLPDPPRKDHEHCKARCQRARHTAMVLRAQGSTCHR